MDISLPSFDWTPNVKKDEAHLKWSRDGRRLFCLLIINSPSHFSNRTSATSTWVCSASLDFWNCVRARVGNSRIRSNESTVTIIVWKRYWFSWWRVHRNNKQQTWAEEVSLLTTRKIMMKMMTWTGLTSSSTRNNTELSPSAVAWL
jgi:hypothetical protein